MTTNRNTASIIRLISAGALIALAAYYAGGKWGEHQIQRVENVFAQAGNARSIRAANLTEDEALTVKIYSQAAPAVANINTQAVEYDFFRDPVPVRGAGSGFLIDPRGYVVTNYHVVQGAQNIEVTLGDRTHYPAKFVGADERNDVALVKIDLKGKTITALPLGDSDNLLVGQRVLAIGNPFGAFSSTLTTGVVSAVGRTIQTGDTTIIDEAIQTDAAINQGNSGGPLLNTHGEVIGINSAIYTPSGTTAGIGFAIPINTAKKIAQDLITEGRVHRASLGIPLMLELWPDLAEALNFSANQEGLLIERINANGPAARAGLKAGDQVRRLGFFQQIILGGDLIVAVDGKEVAHELDLDVILNRKKPGDNVRVTVFRGGKKMDVNVTLGEAAQSVQR